MEKFLMVRIWNLTMKNGFRRQTNREPEDKAPLFEFMSNFTYTVPINFSKIAK